MYIFLDESKKLHKKWWKFILSWLVTNLKPWTIDRIYNEFLKENWIKEVWWEVKSFDKKFRKKIDNFFYFIKNSKYSNNIEFVWIFAKNYFENGENYFSCLEYLVKHTIEFNKVIKKIEKINIFADNLKLNFDQDDIRNLLNKSSKLKKYKTYKWYNFVFSNSKRYWWIKFADFISWKLNMIYIKEKEEVYNDFIELFVNEEITFIKLK